MKKLFQTVCETPISAPKKAFNLHDWVFTLSDKDYQTTARGHIVLDQVFILMEHKRLSM